MKTRPLEPWEEMQLDLLESSGLAAEAGIDVGRLRAHPEEWRSLREQLHARTEGAARGALLKSKETKA